MQTQQEWAWLRSLAAQLAGSGDADDLVQDTWFAAEAAVARPRARASWLKAILRNNARMSWRGAARREARERQAAMPEASAIEARAHAAVVVGVLREIVADLPEAQRQLVELRAAGLSAGEVGRVLGIPEATARTRTHRVIKKLRAELDARFGERNRWLQWGVFMSTTKVLSAVAVAGALLALGLTQLKGDPDPPSPPPRAAAPVEFSEADRISVAAKLEQIRRARRTRRQRQGLPFPGPKEPEAEACDRGCIGVLGMQIALAHAVSGCRDDLPADAQGRTRFVAHVVSEPGVGAAVDEVEVLEDSVGDAAFVECIAQSAPMAELSAASEPVSDRFVFRYSVGTPSNPAPEFLSAHPDLAAGHPELEAIVTKDPTEPLTTEQATAFARFIADDASAQETFATWVEEQGIDLAMVAVNED